MDVYVSTLSSVGQDPVPPSSLVSGGSHLDSSLVAVTGVVSSPIGVVRGSSQAVACVVGSSQAAGPRVGRPPVPSAGMEAIM